MFSIHFLNKLNKYIFQKLHGAILKSLNIKKLVVNVKL